MILGNGPPGLGDGGEGDTPNGNGSGNSANGSSGNGIISSEKCISLTPSPLTRTVDDVKSEPMELVCTNNNTGDEHSNDWNPTETDVHRSGSGDCGKGSLRFN